MVLPVRLLNQIAGSSCLGIKLLGSDTPWLKAAPAHAAGNGDQSKQWGPKSGWSSALQSSCRPLGIHCLWPGSSRERMSGELQFVVGGEIGKLKFAGHSFGLHSQGSLTTWPLPHPAHPLG